MNMNLGHFIYTLYIDISLSILTFPSFSSCLLPSNASVTPFSIWLRSAAN